MYPVEKMTHPSHLQTKSGRNPPINPQWLEMFRNFTGPLPKIKYTPRFLAFCVLPFSRKYNFRPSPPPPLFQSRPSPFLVPDPRSFWLSGMSSYRLCSLTNQNAEFHAAANQIPTFRVLNQSHSFPGRTDEKRGQ